MAGHFKAATKMPDLLEAKRYHEDRPAEAFMALSSGLCKTAAAGKMGISKNTFYSWMDKYPLFAEAVEIGLAQGCTQWWDLAQHPEHDQFDAKIIMFALKCVYHLRDDPLDLQLMAGIELGDAKSLERAKSLAKSLRDELHNQG